MLTNVRTDVRGDFILVDYCAFFLCLCQEFVGVQSAVSASEYTSF